MTIMEVTSNEMADEYETCPYCDRIVGTPNFAYHVCPGRKLFRGTKAAQQSVHPTGGILPLFQALSTPEQNPALGHYPSPPTSG